MSETQRDIARTGQWAVERLAQRLGQEPQHTRDSKYGAGVGYFVRSASEPMPRSIDFFEPEQVVTIDTPNLHVELFNASAPRPSKHGVSIEDRDGTTRLLFLRNGHVAVEVKPPSDAESLESSVPSAVATERQILDSATNDAPEVPGGENEPSDAPVALPAGEAREKQPTVRIKGNIARPPSYKPTPNGTPRVMMQLAEHPDESDREKTVYHFIYSLGTWAQKIQAKNLTVGEPVRISGYRQPYEHRLPNGTTETRERIFAIHVAQIGRKPASQG